MRFFLLISCKARLFIFQVCCIKRWDVTCEKWCCEKEKVIKDPDTCLLSDRRDIYKKKPDKLVLRKQSCLNQLTVSLCPAGAYCVYTST